MANCGRGDSARPQEAAFHVSLPLSARRTSSRLALPARTSRGASGASVTQTNLLSKRSPGNRVPPQYLGRVPFVGTRPSTQEFAAVKQRTANNPLGSSFHHSELCVSPPEHRQGRAR